MRKVATILLLICGEVFAQQRSTFTDSRDGKKYKTVEIGEQKWMAQNLDYHGADGYLGLCYGDEPKKKIRKPENCKKYGRLYNWSEAMVACPEGWHLPSYEEWQTLVDFAGGNEVAGKKLKSKNEWKKYDFSGKSPNAPKCKYTEEKIDERGRITVVKHDYCTTDEFGFSALPGGDGSSDGYFSNVGDVGSWWSATGHRSNYAYLRIMLYSGSIVVGYYYYESSLLSVRCVQD